MKNKLLTITLFAVVVVKAQLSLNNYFMDFSPHSIAVNPAQKPFLQNFIGIPGLGNTNLELRNSGFTMAEALNNNTVSFEDIIGVLAENNTLSTGVNLNILSFGISLDSVSYLNFSTGINGSGAFNYSGKFMRFFLLGQGNEEFLGKEVSLEGTSVAGNLYSETAIGYQRQLSEKLRIGGRIKMLGGIANVNADLKDVSVYTEDEDYDITFFSNFEMRTSGLNFSNPVATSFGNLGLGLDLSGNYRITDQLNVSASVLDLGYINWKKNTQKYYHENASFEYNGIQFDDLDSDKDGNYFDNLADSIVEIFELQEEEGFSYTTYLPTRFVVGAQYEVLPVFTVDALFSTQTIANRTKPTFIIGGSYRLGSILQTRLSYAYLNQTNNVGASIAVNLGAFQLFVLADNILGFNQLDYTNSINFQMGLNIVLGKRKALDKRMESKKASSEEG